MWPTALKRSRSEFPQVFAAAIDREIVRLSRLLELGQLSTCTYESPETRPGACDGWPCHQMANRASPGQRAGVLYAALAGGEPWLSSISPTITADGES